MVAAQDPPFRVVYSEAVREGLRELCRRAQERALGHQTLDAIQEIDYQLHHTPAEFGEPAFHLKLPDAELRKGAISPLLVCYGVYEQQRLVFVFWFKPMPGSGL